MNIKSWLNKWMGGQSVPSPPQRSPLQGALKPKPTGATKPKAFNLSAPLAHHMGRTALSVEDLFLKHAFYLQNQQEAIPLKKGSLLPIHFSIERKTHPKEAHSAVDEHLELSFMLLLGERVYAGSKEIEPQSLVFQADDQYEAFPENAIFFHGHVHGKMDLDLWPNHFPPREEIPHHIKKLSYALGHEPNTPYMVVELRIHRWRVFYHRSLTDILFDGPLTVRDLSVNDLPLLIRTGAIPFLEAAFKGHPEWVKEPVGLSMRQAAPLLFWMVETRNPELVRLAISVGANPKDDIYKDLVHRAVTTKKTEIIEILAVAGAPLNLRDKRGLTPLLSALKAGLVEVEKSLLKLGADPTIPAENGYDYYALKIMKDLKTAASAGDLEKVKTFLNRQDVLHMNLVDLPWDRSALFLAAEKGQVEVLEMLIPHSKNLDQCSIAYAGTPLMAAVWGRHRDAVACLLAAGANPRETTKGHQALHLAARVNSRRIARQLIEAGADPNVCDEEGETPLMIVAEEHKYGRKLVQFLLEAGAELQATNAEGQTALDKARDMNHQRIVDLLEGPNRTIF